MKHQTTSSPAEASAQDSAFSQVVYFLTRTVLGNCLLAIALGGIFLLVYCNKIESIGSHGVVFAPPAKECPPASKQLATFEHEVDACIATTYKAFNEEGKSHGQETRESQALLYIIVQLTDIKITKIPQMREACNNDPCCVADSIASKRNYIKTKLTPISHISLPIK